MMVDAARGRRAVLFEAVVAASLAVGLLAPGLLNGPTLDAAVFSVVASRLRAGNLPYLQTWDHKPPGIYLLDGLAQTVLPFLGSWTAAWIASVVCAVAAIILLAILLRRDPSPGGEGITLLAAAIGLTAYPLALGGGLTELACLPFVLAAVVLALGSRGRTRRAALAGVLAGIGSVMTFQALPAAAAVAYLLLRRPGGGRLATTIGFAIGGLAVAAAVSLWLWVTGDLGAALDALVAYNRAYVSINHGHLDLIVRPLLVSALCLAPLVLAAAASIVDPGIRSRVATPLRSAAWVWLIVLGIMLALEGRVEEHYVLLAVPPLAILGRPLFRLASSGSAGLQRASASVLVVIGASVAILVISIQSPIDLARYVHGQQLEATGDWIQEHTGADARVFVWGNEPQAYETSGRSVASKYVYFVPLVTPGYSSPDQVAELVSSLTAELPAVIVDAGSGAPGEPGAIALLIPRPSITDGRVVDLLEPLRELVRNHYRLAAIVSGWPVYVRE